MDSFPFVYCGLIIPNYLQFILGSLLYPRRIPWYFGRELRETMGNELHSRDGTFLDGIDFDHGYFIAKDGKNTLSSRCCLWLSVLSSSDRDEDIAPETINPFQIVNNTFEPRPVGHPEGIRASSKDADLIPPPRPTPPPQRPSIQKENSSDCFNQLKEHKYRPVESVAYPIWRRTNAFYFPWLPIGRVTYIYLLTRYAAPYEPFEDITFEPLFSPRRSWCQTSWKDRYLVKMARSTKCSARGIGEVFPLP